MTTPMLRIGGVRADQESDVGMPSVPVWTHDYLGRKTLEFVPPSQAKELAKLPPRQFSDGTWSGLSDSAKALCGL